MQEGFAILILDWGVQIYQMKISSNFFSAC